MSRLGRTINRNHARKAAQRNAFGIQAFVGANGGGKSVALVSSALPDLEAGRPVLSTVRILDYENPRECDDDRCASNPDRLGHVKRLPTPEGRQAMIRNEKAFFFEGENAPQEHVETYEAGIHQAAHELWIPWSRWEQLLRFNFGRVLADEMTGVASSTDSMTLPSEVINQLQQLRRSDIPFGYTCPDWARTVKSLREPTQAVTVCTGYLKTEAPMEGEVQRIWKPRRLFKWQTYDARRLDKMTEGHTADTTAEVTEWLWGPDSTAFRAYDTFAPVLTVGTIAETGRCFRCGGRRRSIACSCSDHQHGPDDARPETPAGAPAQRGGRRRRTSDAGSPVTEQDDAPTRELAAVN